MAAKIKPPFRAEHVGSLHRPAELRAARARILGLRREGDLGRHDNAELTSIEDDAIRTIVELQEDVGLRTITDGEYRRQVWLTEFTSSLDGLDMSLRIVPGGSMGFRSDERAGKSSTEDVENVKVEVKVTKPIRWVGSSNVDAFKFLKQVTRTGVPKVTIPAPAQFYFFGGPDCIDRKVYPDLAAFWSDLAVAYRQELRALADAGCTHVQFDDVVNACLCDPIHIERVKQQGDDPNALLRAGVECLNEALVDRPSDMLISMHICRGNRHGHFMASGGYDGVADYLFNTLDIDNYYLEFDTPRAGSFEPLRLMPSDRTVVLGLVTTKRPELESKDELRRRIEEASRYIPLERLALSPQCGFSGDMMSDVMSIGQMRDKLRLVVETARSVWDDA